MNTCPSPTLTGDRQPLATGQRLQGKVVLIVNGLSDAGCALAESFAANGADVAVVDFRPLADEALVRQVRQSVELAGRRCLVLWPGEQGSRSAPTATHILQTINEALGCLDVVISYAVYAAEGNGRFASNPRISASALTQAALQQIVTQ